ncbi:MAG: hypothetical protein ACE5G5_09920 [Candidatus Methylomirabilales bacterium]
MRWLEECGTEKEGRKMTPIEIIATILAIFVLVKVSIILINPKLWMKGAGAVLSNYVLAMLVYAILAGIVGA